MSLISDFFIPRRQVCNAIIHPLLSRLSSREITRYLKFKSDENKKNGKIVENKNWIHFSKHDL